MTHSKHKLQIETSWSNSIIQATYNTKLKSAQVCKLLISSTPYPIRTRRLILIIIVVSAYSTWNYATIHRYYLLYILYEHEIMKEILQYSRMNYIRHSEQFLYRQDLQNYINVLYHIYMCIVCIDASPSRPVEKKTFSVYTTGTTRTPPATYPRINSKRQRAETNFEMENKRKKTYMFSPSYCLSSPSLSCSLRSRNSDLG